MNSEENRNTRRDKKAWNRKHGVRVDNRRAAEIMRNVITKKAALAGR